MLYKLYETQRSLMEPFTDLAASAAKLYANPQSLMGKLPCRNGFRRATI